MNPTIAVLYHANCYDGFGAAYAAWKLFKEQANYIPVSYGKPLPEGIEQYSDVFIVDFSYPRQTLLELAEKVPVCVLDHHKTAQADLEGLTHPNLEIIFDMGRSGALIAWNYFHPFDQVPFLIDYISDRDLWKFKLPGSKEVHAALTSYPFDFELWDKFNVDDLMKEGEISLKLTNSLVEKVCSKSFLKEIAGYVVPVVNTTTSWSEVGELLQKQNPDKPFAASFTEFEDGTMWSLRSSGDFDVSKIAKLFGGGGHKNAAGFKIPKDNALPLNNK